ncbi:nucleotidyltransferase-like protein [Paenibacillus turpanensis]|uniref:nucleotidyltransferase-like protein n=1 Tax=Paenibacillus turpanensis TaxID=2689078 RepID=UPI00140D06C6|nr:nucleotidyltransferase-like protein [Paenibacillus turpanensis]
METLRQHYTRKLNDNPIVQSALFYLSTPEAGKLTDTFDVLLVIICSHDDSQHTVSHYSKEGLRIQERWMNKAAFLKLLAGKEMRSALYELLQGEILVDHDLFLEEIRDSWSGVPDDVRRKKLFAEFASFLRTYLLSKEYMLDGDIMDAYNFVLEALHHWARIVLIEAGLHPEVTVWKQVRSVNPGVYKLYEELASSRETVEQRVQLVLLACEFSIMSKMKLCCEALLQVLESREEPWSYAELNSHSELSDLSGDLALVLRRLANKQLIKEVAFAVQNESDLLEIRYTLRPEYRDQS